MVPTLAATLGVKGHRPTVGSRDNKDLLHVFGGVNWVTAAVHANPMGSPRDAKRKTGRGKTRRMPRAIADHPRHVGRVCPAGRHPPAVLLSDNAPWHRGELLDGALADNPHLRVERLPSHSPQWNPVERFWKKLRRRATHNRLFDTLADQTSSVRASRSYFQSAPGRVRPLHIGLQKRKAAK